jgi:hypothetical protein
MCIRWLVVTPCNYVGVYWDQICDSCVEHPKQYFDDPVLDIPVEEEFDGGVHLHSDLQSSYQVNISTLASNSRQTDQPQSQQQAESSEPKSPTEHHESRQSSLSTRNNSLIPSGDSTQAEDTSSIPAEQSYTFPPPGPSPSAGYRLPANTQEWREGRVGELPR